jgi:CRP-like cAMP-binding protein
MDQVKKRQSSCPGRGPEGLYFNDTRFLSWYEFRFEGKRPLLLERCCPSGTTADASATTDACRISDRRGLFAAIRPIAIAVEALIGAPVFSPLRSFGPTGRAGNTAMASEHSGQGRRNRLLAALTPADYSLLAPDLKELSLELGALLQEAGEPVEHIYFPHQGMVSLLAMMSDGQGIETATVGSEGVVGAMSGFGIRRGFTRSVVQAPLLASRISSAQFHTAVQKSEGIRNLIMSYNAMLLAQVQQTAACNALHSTESRLARWLLQTRDRIDSDVLPLTQEFLSQMLGVRRTTVTLVARQLEQAGVIQNRRGRIVIVDRKGLEDVACECYAIVRDQVSVPLI